MRTSSFLGLGPDGFHRIVYSEWGDPANPRVVVCVHGLTRNRRDFDALAQGLAGDFRVACMDVVGRGESDWLAHRDGYTFTQYQRDAVALIARLTAPARVSWLGKLLGRAASEAHSVDWIGTSMGGLIGMLLASRPKSPIRRLVLNDVGPLVSWLGLLRLKGYAARGTRFATLDEVEAYLRDVCEPFGLLSNEQWRHLAQHSAQALPEGGYALNYDPEIIRALRSGKMLDVPLGERFLEGVDLWSVWDTVACPVLALRGAESDVLTEKTAGEMQTRGPRAQVVEFEGVGHAPALMDAAQIAVVRDFLRQ